MRIAWDRWNLRPHRAPVSTPKQTHPQVHGTFNRRIHKYMVHLTGASTNSWYMYQTHPQVHGTLNRSTNAINIYQMHPQHKCMVHWTDASTNAWYIEQTHPQVHGTFNRRIHKCIVWNSKNMSRISHSTKQTSLLQNSLLFGFPYQIC